jgi:hypothetical protein
MGQLCMGVLQMETCQMLQGGFIKVKGLHVHTLSTCSWSFGLVDMIVLCVNLAGLQGSVI